MTWRAIQKQNFTSLSALCSFLELSEQNQKQLLQKSTFALNIPRRLAEKIEKNQLDDPILRQFVPLIDEELKVDSFVKDPVQDCKAAQTPKLLQKYQARLLLLTTQACAMHCRFCFRKNYNYAPLQTGFEEELKIIREDQSLKEVILSGGDPLSLENRQLKNLLQELSSYEHIKRIRFHTRFPIGIPERIDDEFLAILRQSRCQIWFLIHTNHPRELDSDVLASLKKIQKLGIPVLSQTVLLKGVNDSIETFSALCEKLCDNGIIPYYLHQLDKVEGSAHFEVSQQKGRELIEQLNRSLAGYGVPKYVQEIPHEPYKFPLT